MMMNSDHRPSQAIINLAAIRHNLEIVKQKLHNHQKIYTTVKANAYGHGALPVAKAALEAGAEGLLVATVDEGIQLRKQGLTQVPILVLGLTDPRGIAEIIHYELTVTVCDADFFAMALNQLVKTNQEHLLDKATLKFHLALDTGMGRIGLRTQQEIEEFVEAMEAYPWAEWEGVFTHFATAGGGPTEYVDYQMNRWQDLLTVIPSKVSFRHYANSAMALWYNEVYPSDIVRLGISLYGIDPQDQLDNAQNPEFIPAMELISEIIYVKQVEAGTCISYGATYQAQETEWIATIPMGYGDGWLRSYHPTPVIVAGQLCPVVGVINMDQLMIRLPKYYPIGTTVTFIGKDGSHQNYVSQIARDANTIGYEITTTIATRVPRIYLNESNS